MIGLSNKGSSLIEACAAAAFLQILLGLGLPALYFIFAHVWIQFQSQEALVCLAEKQPIQTCDAQLQKRLNLVLPWGHCQTHLLRDPVELKSSVTFALNSKLKFKIDTHIPAEIYHAHLL